MTYQHLQVAVIMSRCRRDSRDFGIRLEHKTEGKWIADWAFGIEAAAAKREGYDQTTISGIFEVDAKYPGCPYCESSSFFKCDCGKVACWDQNEYVTCPWCRQSIQLTARIESLDVAAIDKAKLAVVGNPNLLSDGH
jgi:hypothetical protein